MKALLLAAGFGTRLHPLTSVIPKCMVPINGRPLLEYWLKILSDAGISEVLVNLHFLPDIIKKFLQENTYSTAITISFEDHLLGTAGTLLFNKRFFGSEPIMMVHADNLCFCDFGLFIRNHHERPLGTEITMMTFNTSEPEKCGIVELDTKGVVLAFHEKVKSYHGTLANAAVYIIEPSLLGYLVKLNKDVIDFSTEVLPHYIGKIYTYHNAFYHKDIGNINNLMEAQKEFPYVDRFDFSNDNDTWNSFCGTGGYHQARRIMLALSEALNVSILQLIPEEHCKLLEGLHISSVVKENVLLVADRIPSDFEGIAAELKERYIAVAQIFVLFHIVPIGYSSREIFEKYGLKTFAICACRY